MADWVFDSLVGYLQSPIWTYPVDSFLDHHCVVFDRGEENKFSYTDIHREYQTMVENLLESFMSDLGITPEMFTEACSQTGKLAEEHEVHFERILAADDFLAFKAMMVKRNIDLEQQALALLQKQLGRSPEAYQAMTEEPPRVNRSEEEEDSTLKEVLQQSKKEFDLQHSLEEDELEKLIELAKEESLKLYQASQREQQEEIAAELEKTSLLSGVGTSEQVVDKSTQQQRTSGLGKDEECADSKMEGQDTLPVPTPAVPITSEVKQTDTAVPMKSEQRLCERQLPFPPQTRKPATSMYPLPSGSAMGHSSHPRELTGSEAAAMWLESARSEVQQSTTCSSKHHQALGPSPEDLRDREVYLKRQRDHLLEMKKKARAQEFDTYATSLSRSRPKSAQVALISATRGESGQEDARKSGHNTGVLCTAIARRLKEQGPQENHS